jgi:hypothetical protein
MTDDSNKFVQQTVTEEFEYPPPARFDDSASANAQPVEPLPTSRIVVWKQRVSSARRMISGKTIVLTLVIIGGLAIGAVGGTMLVRQRASLTDSAPVIDAPTTETTTDSQRPAHEPRAEVSTAELPNALQTNSRFRNRRTPRTTRRTQQRAYRVAVIH